MIKKLLLVALLSMGMCSAYAGDPLDINNANAEMIAQQLAGIGPSKAEAIVKYRLENGPFHSVDELMSVSGIGERTLSSIRDNVVIVMPAQVGD